MQKENKPNDIKDLATLKNDSSNGSSKKTASFIKTLSRDVAGNLFRNTKEQFEPYWRDIKNKWRE